MSNDTQDTKLTKDQLTDALNQLHAHCTVEMEKPTRDQSFLSVRGSLADLGYVNSADRIQIMDAIYDHGFTYCFDPEYPHKASELGIAEVYPPLHACYWMPDQLKSRLPTWFYKETP